MQLTYDNSANHYNNSSLIIHDHYNNRIDDNDYRYDDDCDGNDNNYRYNDDSDRNYNDSANHDDKCDGNDNNDNRDYYDNDGNYHYSLLLRELRL